ncbi:alpha/beta hydrolase [Alteromonas oceanisediminis]|uniref:alpha/beta hydrolase n=1 Tax=Alteromonas oceanisediminis TaxID=2836180 RepID=UPI001BD92750|nr:alpha/beta hydrolase fold domain-containing protein [Alteromonas oceanisediminis]MBT0585181.1 alpha/beta hydrolase [Alteromonas oceanisediminis]
MQQNARSHHIHLFLLVFSITLQSYSAETLANLRQNQTVEAETNEVKQTAKALAEGDNHASFEYLSQSNAFFIERLNSPQRVIDGQTLHPKMQYLLEKYTNPEQNKGYEKMLRSEQGRELFRQRTDINWPARGKISKAMKSTQDKWIETPEGKLQIRIYTPLTEKDKPLPVLVYFHGGSYIFGSIDALDRAVRLIANEANVIVVSANYRLAPEYHFPAPVNDATYIYDWVVDNLSSFGGDAGRIAVGGDSAGAFLSLTISLKALENDKRVPDYQLLYYPHVDVIGTGKYDSEIIFKNGYGLDPWIVDTTMEYMFPDGIPEDNPFIDVLVHPQAKHFPPTYVGTAGFDILRDHGFALVNHLKQHNISVTHGHYPSLLHNYLEYSGVMDDAEDAAMKSAHSLGQFFWDGR